MSDKQKLLELLPSLSVNGSPATCRQVEMMASELMACRHEIIRLQDLIGPEDVESIRKVLEE